MIYHALVAVRQPRHIQGPGITTVLLDPGGVDLGLEGLSLHGSYGPPVSMGRLFETEISLMKIAYDGPAPDIRALDSADVLLLPPLGTNVGDMTVSARKRFKDLLSLHGDASYDYTNQGGEIINVPSLDVSDLLVGNPSVSDILTRIKDYLQLGKLTGKEGQVNPADHNTEFLDDFTTDPFTSRMTETGNARFTYDAIDDEVDATSTNPKSSEARYDSDTGSIDMEAQCSHVTAATSGFSGTACRFRPGSQTLYFTEVDNGGSGTVFYSRFVAGTYTNFGSDSIAISDAVWVTVRLSAEGSGATVTLDTWITNHTSTKPSDPGWIGDDDTPDGTIDDTAATRIVDSDAQRGGMQFNQDGGGQFDWFKARAVSDRGAAGLSIPVAMHGYRQRHQSFV